MKINTNLTYQYDKNRHGENPTGLSLTQPDLAFSVQELLERFTHGSMPAVIHEGTYQEDADFDNYDKTRDGAFDLADAVLEKEALMIAKAEKDAAYQEKVKAKQELLKKEQLEFAWWKQKKQKEEAEKPAIPKKEEDAG